MRRSSNIRSAALAVAALALLGLLAADAKAQGHQRPFKESGTLDPSKPTGMNGSKVSYTQIFNGHATHLGKVVVYIEGVFDTSDGTYSGTFTKVAANGDKLYGSFAGGYTSATTFAGAQMFTGGTGRFQGATGSQTSAGTTDPATGFSTLKVEGWISY